MWNSHPPAKAFEQPPIIPSSFGESTNCGRLANIKGLNLITVMLGMLCGQKNGRMGSGTRPQIKNAIG